VKSSLATLQRELRRRMDGLGISARALSTRAGVNNMAVRDILNGKSRKPTLDTLEKLAGALGCTVADLTGTGAPRPSTHERAARDSGAGGVAITELDVYASAGGGAVVESETAIAEWRFPAHWLHGELHTRPDQVHVLTIQGDSMTPALMPGDKVIVDLSQQAPSPAGIFVVHDGIALVAKRLEFIEGSSPPRVRILSDNKVYETYERTVDEIRIAGRIVARWQRL
jgi:phage repressor protein C with HTH and peptisase S24 domain